MLFPVTPKILDRVEFRGISRKKLQLQTAALFKDEIIDQAAPVASEPVPYDQHLASNVAQQVFQELHHLGATNRTGKQAKIKLSPRHSRHGRQMLPVKMILQNRRLPFGRPSPTTVGPLAQPTLI